MPMLLLQPLYSHVVRWASNRGAARLHAIGVGRTTVGLIGLAALEESNGQGIVPNTEDAEGTQE